MFDLTKLALLFSLGCGLLLGANVSFDYTPIVNESERLSKVFAGIDVSDTNAFQAVFIIACDKVSLCGR